MILTESVLNAYINANIMLLFAFALWNFTRFGVEKLGFKLAYIFQLRLLNGVFLAIALSPLRNRYHIIVSPIRADLAAFFYERF